MTSAGNDYLTKRSKQIERKKRIVTYISLCSFCGSMLFGAFNTIKQSLERPAQQQKAVSTEDQVQNQVKGYELVLQREPNNQMALENLSIIRLKTGDNQGAIALLEKLVQQHPDRQDYKTVLADVKKNRAGNNQAGK
ncbi:tetratricopeptide repeat protein [Anabaena sp. FACHB-1237]|uniref:tetratricopeptide repeat protein n=1 Tax=Anabaena sp. FACHB-1237 TaxID=2692769 RepID=UPI00168113EB|nr:tetratricopeptide repeat protein [Anabaena sp. FACHB-1237]MBD2139344.1 tetratricopeptide repeat protein [Anabaena sp. FACHB-1237]